MRLLELVVGAPISEALGWTLVHLLWEGAIIAAALAAFLALVRSPRIRYVAACVALIAVVASFTITLIHFLPEHGRVPGPLNKMALPFGGRPSDAIGSYGDFRSFETFVPWIAPLWIIGVCLFYMWCVVAWFSLSRMRRRGACSAPALWQQLVTRLACELKVSRPVVLLESLLADTPMVLGHFRPIILVPLGFLAGLSPDQVEVILLHELAHIRRWDYLANVCQRLVEGLLFYHPAVWWISHVIRAERENCCDDAVVGLRGDAQGYARALTALEQNRVETWPTGEPVVAATGGNLMKRTKRLLYPKGPSGFWAPALAATVLLASTAMLMAARHVSANASHSAQQTDQSADNPWQKWLNEDVVYIITEQEKSAFEAVKTDEERQQFVEQFWVRRDPTPGTPENEFKEEYYRRIAFANKHWGGNEPGWKTDRGRMYIKFGPPDEIDSHPAGGNYKRPESEGGGSVMTYPFEDWRYAHFEGLGSLTIEFVDTSSTGDFRMTLDPKEKYKHP